MTFKVRKIAPVYPEQPYSWDAQSKGQCTWYAYYRAIEVGFNPPCWWDRATLTGSYTNAKDWLENYRDPWEVKGPDYTPTAGDIAVFDGNYGHVAFIERNNNDGTCTITDYNRVAPETFALDTWKIGVSLTSTGKLIGYLHWPTTEKVVNPVKRDITRDQIKTTDTTADCRLKSWMCCSVKRNKKKKMNIISLWNPFWTSNKTFSCSFRCRMIPTKQQIYIPHRTISIIRSLLMGSLVLDGNIFNEIKLSLLRNFKPTVILSCI